MLLRIRKITLKSALPIFNHLLGEIGHVGAAVCVKHVHFQGSLDLGQIRHENKISKRFVCIDFFDGVHAENI